MTTFLLTQLLLLGVMLAASFFFSSSETALFSLSARHLADIEEGDKAGARVHRLLARPYHLLVLLLLGNNVVNIAAAELTHRLVEEGAGVWNLSAWGTTALSVAVGTGLLLIAGEIGPKTLALHMPLALASRTAGPLLILDRALTPIVTAFTAVSNAVLRRLGVEHQPAARLSEEELKTIVTVSEEEGVLDEDEREMIDRVFDLGETLVREHFVPRPDVVRVGADATVREVLSASAMYGHSRIPVVGETIDDVRGICNVKDLIPYVRSGQVDHPIRDVLRPAAIVPDTKRVGDCLREFRRQRIHMAIVVDEYGGTAGIVTLEDLLETIIGDIYDEYDDFQLPVVQVSERRWRVDGSVPLSELHEQWGGILPESEYDTVGGLVLELFGRFPYPGEAVEHGGITYTIEKVGRNRLQRILLDLPDGVGVGVPGNGQGGARNGNGGRP